MADLSPPHGVSFSPMLWAPLPSVVCVLLCFGPDLGDLEERYRSPPEALHEHVLAFLVLFFSLSAHF